MTTTKTGEQTDKNGMTLDEVIAWADDAKRAGVPGDARVTAIVKIGSPASRRSKSRDERRPAGAVHEFRRHPDREYVIDLPPAYAGRFVRRHIRTILHTAEVRGVDVKWREEKGLLESIFVARLRGKGRDLAPHVQRLIDLIAAAR